jgi:hypothetical protein
MDVSSMGGVHKLFNKVADDLRITKFSFESESQYYSRLIYSAIGNWILHCVNDKSITESDEQFGVSKSYLLRRCASILNDLLEMCPQAKSWFFSEEIDDCSGVVKYIRDIYEFTGYLVSGGHNTSLVLPKYCNVAIEDHLVLIRGIAKVGKMNGLGGFVK